MVEFSWAWWHTTVGPARGKMRQEDCKCEASRGYVVKPYFKQEGREEERREEEGKSEERN